MTKGKYAEKAAIRRAHLEAEGNLGTYQKRVAELTAENKALKDKAVEQQRSHSAEVKRLKAERTEGTSPTLRAVETECRRLRDDLDQAQREVRLKREQGNRAMRRLIAHFLNGHGMGHAQAIEAAAPIFGKFGADYRDANGGESDATGHEEYGDDRVVLIDDDNPGLRRLDVDRVQTLQRIRGARR